MLNRVTWAGLIAMAIAVLLYLGGLLTTFTRPMLPWIAAVGGVLFIGGITLAIIHRGQPGHTKTPTVE
jgi:Na+/H+ antiporter NhaA